MQGVAACVLIYSLIVCNSSESQWLHGIYAEETNLRLPWIVLVPFNMKTMCCTTKQWHPDSLVHTILYKGGELSTHPSSQIHGQPLLHKEESYMMIPYFIGSHLFSAILRWSFKLHSFVVVFSGYFQFFLNVS